MRPIKSYFVGVNTPIRTRNNIYREQVYLNSAATGLPLRNVVKKVNNLLPYSQLYDTESYGGLRVTEEFEKVRKTVLEYVNADIFENNVVYVKSSTYAINLLSNLIYQKEPDSIILSTIMDGLASYMPFSSKFETVLVGLTPDGNVDLYDLEQKLIFYSGRVKLVTITGASNITGITPNIYEAARLAHTYGARIFVDTTQLLQHKPFDLKPNSSIEHIDFISFSAHKYYSPYDGGVLVGPSSFLEELIPPDQGPYITNFVSTERAVFKETPFKYETGYPNTLGIIGMGEALRTLKKFGLAKINDYEMRLCEYAICKLKKIDRVKIYALESDDVNVPIVSFNVIGKTPNYIENELGFKYGIIIDSGYLSSDIYVQSLLGLSPAEAYEQYLLGNNIGVCRASFALYNTTDDIDRFINALKEIIKHGGK